MSEIYYDKVYRFLNKRKPPEFLKQPQEQLLQKLRATTVIVAPFSEKDVAAISALDITACNFNSMPYDNFFIETEFKCAQLPGMQQVSVFCYKEDAEDWCISFGSTKDNDFSGFVELSAVIRPSKFPRFYVMCFTPCERQIRPTIFGKLLSSYMCQSTVHTASATEGDCQGRPLIIAALHILFYVIDRINNPKLLHREHKILEYHTHTGNTSNATPRIAYVGKRYIYDTKSEPKGGHHASPVPHDRREHERHYRDKVTGNVIKTVHINSIKVHGGATAAPKQKILKLMGGNEDVF